MRALRCLAGSLLLAFAALPAHATPDARADADIRHLITFIADSGCTFIRNGDAHDAKSASEHLAMKYGKARSRLATPEQFIEHVASASFFTGRPYRVQCPAQAERNSGDWLRSELARWRTTATQATARAH